MRTCQIGAVAIPAEIYWVSSNIAVRLCRNDALLVLSGLGRFIELILKSVVYNQGRKALAVGTNGAGYKALIGIDI